MKINGNTLVDVTNEDIIDGHFIVPEGIEKIENRAFLSCTSLVSITIPPSVERIGIWAFDNCTSLVSITLPPSVKEIGTVAFYGCTSLVSITIPPSVKEIGYGAFHNCTNLNEVNCEDEEIRGTVRFQALIGRKIFSPEQFNKLSKLANKE